MTPNKSPIFCMNNERQPQFTEYYNFRPQFRYFQLLKEARKQKRDKEKTSIDNPVVLHVKRQKQQAIISKIFLSKKRWWRNPLRLFRFNQCTTTSTHKSTSTRHNYSQQHYSVRPLQRALSGPLYSTESTAASHYRTTTRRPCSGQLRDEVEFITPYVSLSDINMDHHNSISTMSMPIYLVT